MSDFTNQTDIIKYKSNQNEATNIDRASKESKTKNLFEKKRLYSFIKHNKNKSIFNEIKEQFEIKDIEKITIFNKSLIYWAVALEHNNLIEDLFEYNIFNKTTYLDEIFAFNVINKNPNILNLINTQILKLTKEEQKYILLQNIDKIAQNCFREENIQIIEQLLFQNLNEKEKYSFIMKAVEYTNISLLNHLNSFENWHLIIKSMKNDILKKSLLPYYEIYKKLVNKATISVTCSQIEEQPISVLTLEKKSKNNEENQSITIPTVIKKRKKIFYL